MKKMILITGATGKQGRALINALLYPPSPQSPTPTEPEYHILALTRHSSSPTSQGLKAEHSENLTLVEGDLNSGPSIREVFASRKEDGGIWGVYAVLPFPGLGVDAWGEEVQGKMLADLALEYGVQAFVYSSANRAGPAYESQVTLSWKAKRNVEGYCRELGEKGLAWAILRPGFFMENLDEFLGSIATAVLRVGLKEEVLGVIGSEDIGNVAAGIFGNFDKYKYKTLTAVAEFSTMSQLGESYKRALAKPMPAIPSTAAWALIKINKGSQDLIKHLTEISKAKRGGEWTELDVEIRLANEAFKMRTYEEYLKREKKEGTKGERGNWNGLSLGKLLTGKA